VVPALLPEELSQHWQLTAGRADGRAPADAVRSGERFAPFRAKIEAANHISIVKVYKQSVPDLATECAKIRPDLRYRHRASLDAYGRAFQASSEERLRPPHHKPSRDIGASRGSHCASRERKRATLLLAGQNNPTGRITVEYSKFLQL
jgi:hypothetical protein